MPVHIQNSGFAQRGNLYTGNTCGLKGYASATILADILNVAGLNGFFRADANTLNMPVSGKAWTVISSGYDATNTANILAISTSYNADSMRGVYVGRITNGTVSWKCVGGNLIELVGSENLNNCTLLGAVYFCATDVVATTLTNSPVTIAFALSVEHTGGGIKQTLRAGNSSAPQIYTRNYLNSAWGNWKRLLNVDDLTNTALSGVPTAPTAVAGANSTQLATTAFVTGAVSTAVTPLAPKQSPALIGTPTTPTAVEGTNNTQIANTAFVVNAIVSAINTAVSPLAPKQSPAFTGIPTAPTAQAGTDTDQIASTAFVQNALDALVLTIITYR